MANTRLAPAGLVLDPVRGLRLRDGGSVPLGQRALAILQALAEAEGRTVSKDDLMARAWPETIVEEGNLTVQIATLRRALGQAAEGREWIVTIPRAGYRLLPGVIVAGGAGNTLPGPPALAVLPFQNLSTDPAQAYFADGVVQDIVAALSRFKSFAVVAPDVAFSQRGEPFDPRRAANDLGVRYMLAGSVRRAGNLLRITAQLIEGQSGAHLWAEHFDGGLADVFDFQDRITQSVAMLVEPRIQLAEIERSRRERPGSFATYDIYLQALAKISAESVQDNAEAYALLTEGLALEPDNAQLLAHAAWAIEHRNTMGWPPFGPDDRQVCAELARRGLEHAAGDAMVMAHCGMSLLQGAKQYDWGMAVMQSAVEANPNNLLIVVRAAVAHLHCGDLDEALALSHRANRLSPGDMGAHFAWCTIAAVHLIRGNHAEALSCATRALALNPNFDPTLWVLIAANAHLGRMDEARRFREQLEKLTPGITVAKIKTGQPDKDPNRVAALVEGLRLAGVAED